MLLNIFHARSPLNLFHVFFFSSRRRHTRSKRDWSSDVCSSDLTERAATAGGTTDDLAAAEASLSRVLRRQAELAERTDDPGRARDHLAAAREAARSEERRVGKECKTREAPYK